MILAVYLFAVIYFSIIFIFLIGIIFSENSHNSKINNISVVIAARNEEEHIVDLLDSLYAQTYPKENFEVIIVDDRSEDNTANLIKDYSLKKTNLTLLKIEDEIEHISGKKRAIEAGIQASNHDILAFTDADCLPQEGWLEQINLHFTNETDIVAGYSYVHYKNKFFELLKNLERSSIFAVIAGSFSWNWGITITAGNMAYRKELYKKVNGFENIGNIKSGDDVLMIQRMNKYARKMKFMFNKNSFVKTGRKTSIESQIHQETRRGSKWQYYSFSVKIMTLFIFIYYLIFSCCLISYFFAGFSTTNLIYLLLLKLIPELLLLTSFLIKVKKLKLMWVFPIAELIYIPYFVIFGLKGTFGKFKWKE